MQVGYAASLQSLGHLESKRVMLPHYSVLAILSATGLLHHYRV